MRYETCVNLTCFDEATIKLIAPRFILHMLFWKWREYEHNQPRFKLFRQWHVELTFKLLRICLPFCVANFSFAGSFLYFVLGFLCHLNEVFQLVDTMARCSTAKVSKVMTPKQLRATHRPIGVEPASAASKFQSWIFSQAVTKKRQQHWRCRWMLRWLVSLNAITIILI